SNGAFWRGDHQGLVGFSYGFTIPALPAQLEAQIPVNIPATATAGDTTIHSATFPAIHFDTFGLLPQSNGTFGPVTLPDITLSGPSFSLLMGGPDTVVGIKAGGVAGPVTFSFIDIPAAPGFGNTTATPSSGFFNSGAGSASGFGNSGADNSGLLNLAFGSSGYQNVGALQSGIANLGNTMSGVYNTGLAVPAHVSGIGNIGHNLAGLLRGTAGQVPVNVGFANNGAGNVGFGNVGFSNVGSGNIGSFNVGSGNIGDYNIGPGNLGD
ncbi:pentapeptide repeat-containing protein, partial [Mycobacterium marinum]